MNDLINHHKIQVSKTAEIITSGELSDTTKEIWIVLHGYAQLPEYFIKSFSGISNAYIIAPSALSKAYIKGFDGRVGAIWMTSHKREDEIADYKNYLNQIVAHFDLPRYTKATINLLGFSQGAATASRFAAQTKLKIDRFILWGGILPTEVENNERLMHMKRYIVYGEQDEFIQPQKDKFLAAMTRYKSNGFTVITYEEKHRIPNNEFLRIHAKHWS